MRKQRFDINGFQDFLLKALQDFVKGCRKVVIAGLPQMGCIPILITERLKPPFYQTCLEDEKADARSYNEKLLNLLPPLQAMLPGPISCFTETKEGCCGSGLLEASFLCNPETPVCETPSDFVFWDSIRPSQAAYKVMSHLFINQILPKLTLQLTFSFLAFDLFSTR
ncbi:putative GDSL-like Lipase/Acylhydrolase family protein [Hibiscus syriacus]|uniref:GDSL-like Lipase/Acylhydrolase family protein n=1 Tax=Hibiscus syriacus TaxID=106335 RepID=A0A6A2ZA04_HIBSY|nr:putative GDSL-like Lipase/Acylhydrolase family protein [Hibiscus syriacus]